MIKCVHLRRQNPQSSPDYIQSWSESCHSLYQYYGAHKHFAQHATFWSYSNVRSYMNWPYQPFHFWVLNILYGILTLQHSFLNLHLHVLTLHDRTLVLHHGILVHTFQSSMCTPLHHWALTYHTSRLYINKKWLDCIR